MFLERRNDTTQRLGSFIRIDADLKAVLVSVLIIVDKHQNILHPNVGEACINMDAKVAILLSRNI